MKSLLLIFFHLSIVVNSQPNHIVISQVYGGGGNTGAVYKNDFIEIFNPTLQIADLSGYSLQYTSAAGTTWSVIPLAGTINAQKYFLVQLSGGQSGSSLPAPDLTSNINLSAVSGKIALVQSTQGLTGSCPSTPSIIDFLGYGTANCSETQAAIEGSNALALLRKVAGCRDTDNNVLDFVTGIPVPKNSLAPGGDCSLLNSNLPIIFSNERLQYKNGVLEISWTNASESGVLSYFIESLKNGNDFKPLREIFPLKNDESSTSYIAELIPVIGKNVYRIKGEEVDGKVSFSKILQFHSKDEITEMQLYPNPVQSQLKIQLKKTVNNNPVLSIYHSSGSKIEDILLQFQGEYALQNIPVYNYVPGLYLIIVDGRVLGKFVKVR